MCVCVVCVCFSVVLIEKRMKERKKCTKKKKLNEETYPDPALAYGGLFDICGKNSAKLIVKNNVPRGTRVSISVSVIDIASKLILGLRFLLRCCLLLLCPVFTGVDTMSP